jgi:hypothetical protein
VASSESVDIRTLMRDELDISAEAASALLCHGHVSIDGRVIGMGETRWNRRELTGRMLKAGVRQTMMFSCGRPIDQRPVEEVGVELDLSDPATAAAFQGNLF